jgi:hypothetical protein
MIKGKECIVFLTSVGFCASIIATQKYCDSEDNFDVSNDICENCYGDVFDSDGGDESSNGCSDSVCYISTPSAQKKQEVNDGNGTPTCPSSERPEYYIINLHYKLAQALTNNLPKNCKCVDIMKHILSTDVLDHLKHQTNKQTNVNEKIIFYASSPSTATSKKRLES